MKSNSSAKGKPDTQVDHVRGRKVSNDYLCKVFIQSPAIICLLRGPDHTYEFANEKYLQLIGHRDIIGKPIRDVLPELEGQKFFELLNEVYTTGESFIGNEMLAKLDRGNGTLENGFFNFVYQAIRDEHERVEGILVHAVEVTEQVTLREKIKESEERYATTVYFSDLGMWDFDTVNKRITATGKMAEIYGLVSNESYTIEHVLASIHPDDREEQHRLYNSIITGSINPAFETEYRIISQDTGKVKWIGAKGRAFFDDQGKLYRTVGKVSDITHRKLAELELKQYKDLIEQAVNLMPLKIIHANADGSIFYYNQNWLDYTGLSIEEIGVGWHNIIHPEELEEFTARWKQAIETGEDFEMELRFLNRHHEFKWNVMRACAIKDEQGKVVKWMGSVNEIHEQRKKRVALEREVIKRTRELKTLNDELLFQNEEKGKRAAELFIANRELIYQSAEKEKRAVELILANQELAFQNEEKEKRSTELTNANKELEAFAYVASHDLQEPLRKIQTFADRVLVNENLSVKGKDYLDWMQDAAERMRLLIQDLLAFSQVSSSERKFEAVDLSLILNEVKAELAHSIQEKHATVEITETCSAHVIVFQFRQLMNNLISNALKFSIPTRPPVIQIACRIVTGNKLNKELSTAATYCHLTVKDNGIGFEPQFSEQIFGAFQKLHGKEVYAGTGLGLSIVKKIVDNHHGFITASGELDKGATFDIYLPQDAFQP